MLEDQQSTPTYECPHTEVRFSWEMVIAPDSYTAKAKCVICEKAFVIQYMHVDDGVLNYVEFEGPAR